MAKSLVGLIHSDFIDLSVNELALLELDGSTSVDTKPTTVLIASKKVNQQNTFINGLNVSVGYYDVEQDLSSKIDRSYAIQSLNSDKTVNQTVTNTTTWSEDKATQNITFASAKGPVTI